MAGIGQAGFSLVQSLTGNPLLDQLMVFSAEYLVLLVPLVILYQLSRGEDGVSEAAFTSTAVAAGIASTYLLGLFYYHQPPQFQGFETILTKELENAFPSQHTAASFSLVWPLIYYNREKLGYVAAAAAALTGFARVYTGLHFPVDIVGGVAASGLGFGVAYMLQDYISEAVGLFFSLVRRF